MNKNLTKRIVSILLVAVMLVAMVPAGMFTITAATYAGDTSVSYSTTWFVEADEAVSGKVWEIWNAADLLAFAHWANEDEGSSQKTPNNFANQTVKLMDDIYLNPNWSASEHGANGIAPTNVWLNGNCDYFTGTFDGNGYTISGMYMKTDSNNVGMFVGLKGGATVKNLAIVNSYFEQTLILAKESVSV